MKETLFVKRIAFWVVLEVGYWMIIGIAFIVFFWGVGKLIMLD